MKSSYILTATDSSINFLRLRVPDQSFLLINSQIMK